MSRPMNALYRNAGFLCVAAMVLAACSENTTTPTPRGTSPSSASLDQSPEFNSPNGQGHLFRTRQWYEQNARPGGGGGGGGNTGIFYHGGPVLLGGTHVVAIYWAADRIYVNGPDAGTSGAGTGDGSVVGFFLQHFASPYFNINSTYFDGNNNHVSNTVFYDHYWANNNNVPTGTQSVSDADMMAMLDYGFDHNQITYSANTIYLIFTAGKVNLGGGFGSSYCAYHGYDTTQHGRVLYAALPYDAAYPGSCNVISTSANGDLGADSEVNTLAHETEEATTDPLLNAWFDRRGQENADKCAWKFGSTYTAANGMPANMNLGGKDFLVQMNWVNAGSGGCAQSYTTP